MFKNPQDEETLCGILKAYVEEYGPEHVIVALPAHWQNDEYSLGAVRLEFTTVDSIEIRVRYESIAINYELELAPKGGYSI